MMQAKVKKVRDRDRAWKVILRIGVRRNKSHRNLLAMEVTKLKLYEY